MRPEWLEKIAANEGVQPRQNTTVEIAKLRDLNNDRSTIGFGPFNSQISHAMKPIPATKV